MSNYNRTILMGRLTRSPELKYVNGGAQSGTAVTEIGLAINRIFKDQGGQQQEETTFVDVTLWGRQAEVACEYLKKGDPAHIEGRLKLDTWEKDGEKRSKLRVVGERLQLLGGRRAEDATQSDGAPAAAAVSATAAVEEEIPF